MMSSNIVCEIKKEKIKNLESPGLMIPCDSFGPEKVIIVNEPGLGLLGYLVIDNMAPGPGKGGLRMAPDVTVDEVFRLARIMTWKCVTAGVREGLPFGGAKAGIKADPKLISKDHKRRLIRGFAEAIRPFCPRYYINAPDMGTDSSDMDIFVKSIGDRNAATGKSKSLGGIDERKEATARGLWYTIRHTLDYYNVDSILCTVALMGFGKVGKPLARFLFERGFKVVAVTDSQGGVYDKDGIDVYDLIKVKENNDSVVHYIEKLKESHPNAKSITNEAMLRLKKESKDEKRILIPAAGGGIYDETIAKEIVADFIFEAANAPTVSQGAYTVFHKRGIVNINDFIANKGGVVISYAELNRLLQPETLLIESVERVLERIIPIAEDRDIPPRTVALDLAKNHVTEKIKERKRLRGY